MTDDAQAPDVLIIDDDDAVREAYAKVLQQAGFSVLAVHSGQAAFAELERHAFRVLVCDYQMPSLKGGALFEQIEEAFPPMASRVVFVTAWANDERIRAILERSGQPILEKPIESEELVAAVRRIHEATA
ncbi:MAG: response regulator [Gemmatimonadales bacterium]|jgi:CheY-like chemotaxis protein